MGVAELHKLTVAEICAHGVQNENQAVDVVALLRIHLSDPQIRSPQQAWQRISRAVLRPSHPFPLHSLLFCTAYAGWDPAALGPAPCWVPTAAGAAATNAARFMAAYDGGPLWRSLASGDPCRDWDLLQRLSVADPEAFWPPVLRALGVWFRSPPHRMLHRDPAHPDAARWLPGGRLNIAECALTGGRDPDAAAILWADEAAPTTLHTLTRRQLAQRAQHVADALAAWGLAPGDAIAIDLPMSPEAVAIFLGIVLAGCTAVCIAESFAPQEIAARLRISGAKATFTQDVVLRGGKALPLYARVTEAGAPRTVVVPAAAGTIPWIQLRQGDLSLTALLALAPPPAEGAALRAHVADAYAPTAILFSSGTTGEPKAIPWTHVTPLRCGADAFFHQDVRLGDALCWPTSMGWMMGPWLVYAGLLNGAALVLFQGSPLGRPFGQFVGAARVAVLGVVPSIVRAWRAAGCMEGLDWSALRCFSSTGEASAPEECVYHCSYLWLSALSGYRPIIEYCGGTEIGGAFLTGSMLQPQAPACFSTPSVGALPVVLPPNGPPRYHGSEFSAITLDRAAAGVGTIHSSTDTKAGLAGSSSQSGASAGDSTNASDTNTTAHAAPAVSGELALQVPMLGLSQRLLNRNHGEVYYAGMPQPFLRRHGDEVEALPGGYYRAMGRVDDTMNLGGIKTSSVELERAVTEGVPGVAEAAAVAVPPPGGGPDRLVLCLVLFRPQHDTQSQPPSQLRQACQAAISSRLNPLFKVDRAVVVAALPRTASNKVMRRVLRDQLVKGTPREAAPTAASKL